MLFHRTDEEFWRMTPGQLASLTRTHNRLHGESASDTPSVRRGTAVDLARFASMALT